MKVTMQTINDVTAMTYNCRDYGLTANGLMFWIRTGDVYTYYPIANIIFIEDKQGVIRQ